MMVASPVAIVAHAAAGEAPDATRLSRLVRQECGSCHGLMLTGGLGSPLTPGQLARWDREQVAAIILNGIPGSPMPPWRALISEADAQWIADVLKQGTLP
jgi:cytochrome c55X